MTFYYIILQSPSAKDLVVAGWMLIVISGTASSCAIAMKLRLIILSWRTRSSLDGPGRAAIGRSPSVRTSLSQRGVTLRLKHVVRAASLMAKRTELDEAISRNRLERQEALMHTVLAFVEGLAPPHLPALSRPIRRSILRRNHRNVGGVRCCRRPLVCAEHALHCSVSSGLLVLRVAYTEFVH